MPPWVSIRHAQVMVSTTYNGFLHRFVSVSGITPVVHPSGTEGYVPYLASTRAYYGKSLGR